MNLIHTVFEPQEGTTSNTTDTAWLGSKCPRFVRVSSVHLWWQISRVCPQGPVQVPLGGSAVGYGWFPLTMGGPLDVKAVINAREALRDIS